MFASTMPEEIASDKVYLGILAGGGGEFWFEGGEFSGNIGDGDKPGDEGEYDGTDTFCLVMGGCER
jgi:hypothetical protein